MRSMSAGAEVNMSEFVKNVLFSSNTLTRWLRQLRVFLHFARGRPHEDDFYAFREIPEGLFLDLGANIGQSALSVSCVNKRLKIFSIEANPACESALKITRKILGKKYRYRIIGVGSHSGTMDFFVPFRSSRMLLEEGSFDRDSLHSPASVSRFGREGFDYSIKTIPVSIVSVDSLNVAPVVVKMDLQGYEFEALVGMTETIKKYKPLVMMEVCHQFQEILELMAGYGYRAAYWKNGHFVDVSDVENPLNVFFLQNQ